MIRDLVVIIGVPLVFLGILVYGIVALVAPAKIFGLMERWVRFLQRQAPALFGTHMPPRTADGERRKRAALSSIRIGGIFLLFCVAFFIFASVVSLFSP